MPAPSPLLLPPASAGRAAQLAGAGGVPSRASLGDHSNNNTQDLGGLTASTKAEKKPQNSETHQAHVRCGSSSALKPDKLINKYTKPPRAAE